MSQAGILKSSSGGVTPSPALSSLSIWLFSTIPNATGDGTSANIIWDQSDFNNGVYSFDASGNITVPNKGDYLLVWQVILVGNVSGVNTFGATSIMVNGGPYSQYIYNPGIIVVPADNESGSSGQIGLNLNAGDKITIAAFSSGGTKVVGIQGSQGGYRTTCATIVQIA